MIRHELDHLQRAVIARHSGRQRDLERLRPRERRRVEQRPVREHRKHGRIHDRRAAAGRRTGRHDGLCRELAAVVDGQRDAVVPRVKDRLVDRDRDGLPRLIRGDLARAGAARTIAARRHLLWVTEHALRERGRRLIEDEVRRSIMRGYRGDPHERRRAQPPPSIASSQVVHRRRSPRTPPRARCPRRKWAPPTIARRATTRTPRTSGRCCLTRARRETASPPGGSAALRAAQARLRRTYARSP